MGKAILFDMRRILVVTLLLACVAAWVVSLTMRDTVPLLWPHGKSQWIRPDLPVNLHIWTSRQSRCFFRKAFPVDTISSQALLSIRAMRDATVLLDRKPLLSPRGRLEGWKEERRADVSALLTPGIHELLIRVTNQDGPTLLWSQIEDVGAYSGTDWETSWDGTDWTPAKPASRLDAARLSLEFPPAWKAFLGNLPWLALIFAAAFVLIYGKEEGNWPEPKRVCWFLLGAWALLGANNLAHIPEYIGFDVEGHLDYIRYLIAHHRVPFANEGWQMFQPPLYHFVAIPFYLFGLEKGVRILSLLCGAAQIELCRRALSSLFPARKDLQVQGLLLGGLLPMNIYLSQSVGNEPLAGVLSALAIVLALEQPGRPHESSLGRPLLIGVCLGLSMLVKVTPVLLFPPLGYLLVKTRERDNAAKACAAMCAAALLVCGWYYLRNWLVLGRPFIGGWDPSRGIVWWQDPGYRTWGQLFSFGAALSHPVYAAVHGFWDSLYSTLWLDGALSSMVHMRSAPPWNYGFMLSGAWLGLFPTSAILYGTVLFAKGTSVRRTFIVACMGSYMAAMIHLYMTVPIYSTAKASYLAGLIPCLAVLGTAGLERLQKGRLPQALTWAGLCIWGLASYISYFTTH